MESPEHDDRNDDDAASVKEILARLAITGPALVETASDIYRKAKLHPGRSHRELRAASLYAACRLFAVPRTLREVSAVCGVDAKLLASSYRKVIEEEGLSMPVQDPASYVSGISSRAGLDTPTERRAIEIINTARRLRTTEGKAPTAVAAAALYMAYMELHPEENLDPGMRVTQVDIAEAAGVSEVALRNRLRTIHRAADEPADRSVTQRD